jgi:hypothetical protein
MKLPTRAFDWTGIRRGHVVAVRPLAKTERTNSVVWECLCDCGNTVQKTSSVLKRGVTYCSQNCPMKPANTKHGGSYTKEYRAWIAMKARCYNETHKNYADYGGRGIIVAPEWLEDFQEFLDYVGRAPTEKHTIDRVDPDGNYVPGNVRWATQAEQCVNKRETLRIELDGEIVPLKVAADRRGVPYHQVYSRYIRGARGEDVFKSAYKDWSGTEQGMLTVIKEDGRDRNGNKLWLCSCTCGNTTHKTSNAIKLGVGSCSTSCGVAESNRRRTVPRDV